MNNLSIKFNPSEADVKILTALLTEYGFYDGFQKNASEIIGQCRSGDFICLYLKNEPIGFVRWHGELQWARLDYQWIIPIHRGKGYGLMLTNLIFEEFIKQNIYYVLAQPVTPCGEGLVTALGFRPLSETAHHDNNHLQYLFLKENRDKITLSNSGYELLIWHDYNEHEQPAQIYKLDDTIKIRPILSIIDGDAHVELRKDGIPIKYNDCKRFFSKTEFQDYGLLYFNVNISEWLNKQSKTKRKN